MAPVFDCMMSKERSLLKLHRLSKAVSSLQVTVSSHSAVWWSLGYSSPPPP